MIHALLLDLDNTLLENQMDRFIIAYMAAVGQYMADRFPPEVFIKHLMTATNAMLLNRDPARTNQEAFDAVFFPLIQRSREEMEPLFDDFYTNHFPTLRPLTRPNPEARPLLEWAFAEGFQIAIATNPLFPLTAIAQRLDWAGVPVEAFPYHLITSYEHMHATKPQPAYFLEIAQRLGCQVEECIMVGDDWEQDIRPAMSVGMHTYWIANGDQKPPEGEPLPAGQGSLADFGRWIRANRML
jgi:FMN phosphatase YigB (HAD superfamily)